MTTAHTAETYTEDEIKGLLQKLKATSQRAAILESQMVDLVSALQGVIRVADRATDEFDAARAALAKAGAA